MFEVIECKKTIDSILKKMPERTKDTLSRRFDIGNSFDKKNRIDKNQRVTLEKIGKDYHITRERVRQIEEKGLEALQNSPQFPKLKKPIDSIKKFIDSNGGLKKEDELISALAPKKEYQSYPLFLLRIGKPFFYYPETSLFYPFWETKKESSQIAEKINNILAKIIEQKKRPLKKEEILKIGRVKIIKTLKMQCPKNHLFSCIEVTKKIEKNPFEEYGIANWPEITPRNIRDKAYLTLKKEQKPMHFRTLAKVIEQKLQSKTQPNTLHNELIKNNKFVLVGRGTYGLQDWGYQNGTVQDIIKTILKKNQNLSRKEIIDQVKKQRMVKETTIMLNLQRFEKDAESKYKL